MAVVVGSTTGACDVWIEDVARAPAPLSHGRPDGADRHEDFPTPFPLAIATVLLFYCGIASFFLTLSLTLRSRFEFAIVPAALVFTVMVQAFLLPTFIVQRIATRWGASALVRGAALLALGHLALAAQLRADTGLPWFVASLVVPGTGLGLVMGPLISRATAAGGSGASAAGFVGTAQWLGNALGVAAVGSMYFALPRVDGPIASHIVFAIMPASVAALLAFWTAAPAQRT
jgi:hypothetical protein